MSWIVATTDYSKQLRLARAPYGDLEDDRIEVEQLNRGARGRLLGTVLGSAEYRAVRKLLRDAGYHQRIPEATALHVRYISNGGFEPEDSASRLLTILFRGAADAGTVALVPDGTDKVRTVGTVIRADERSYTRQYTDPAVLQSDKRVITRTGEYVNPESASANGATSSSLSQA